MHPDKTQTIWKKLFCYLCTNENFAETERLILKEILPADVDGFFEMDSDPDVHI